MLVDGRAINIIVVGELCICSHHLFDFVAELEHIFVEPEVVFTQFEVIFAEPHIVFTELVVILCELCIEPLQVLNLN